MLSARRQIRALWVVFAFGLISGCKSEDPYKDRVYGAVRVRDAGVDPPKDGGGESDAEVIDKSAPSCSPAVSSEHLPSRSSVVAARVMPTGKSVFTKDLFVLFRSHCGGCHVDQDLGGLQVTLANFPRTVTGEVLTRMRSDDPAKFMPPPASNGVPFSQRKVGDPVLELFNLLDAWIKSGSPADVFYPSVEDESTGGTSPYAVTRALSEAMTNLGNCIPTPKLIATETDKMDQLDAFFEAAQALPERLDQTDLVSLDSAVLARYGVVAFAPAYTLWADNAKKVRMIRLPRGKSLEFDPEKQSFKVPPNTRVYKTFYKGVIDHRGLSRYRKVETRVIVSRPDEQTPDGSYKPGALFGTYVWNDEETEATLLRDPLRNGKPFRDRLMTIVTDEQKAEEVIAKGPADLILELEKKNLSRTYALPGSERCIHCHMGAPNDSFVIGVTPLQLKRRPMNEGGVIEPAERDELNQFQRLVSYGIISGAQGGDAVLPLESSQGERAPRNEHELKAQAYMMGNCAHCHNPEGFPSKAAPELKGLLDFWPSKDGGIFQFPLERVSPRILRKRSKNADSGAIVSLEVPYITPSIYDLPEPSRDGNTLGYKWMQPGDGVYCEDTPEQCRDYVFAPWRSLIYRNVDTPFSYSENNAFFPHMPMDTPGYDCRVRQILGTWMVSIPSVWKFQGRTTSLIDKDGKTVTSPLSESLGDPGAWPDDAFATPQQHREVLPGEPTYRQAQFAADRRVRTFQSSSRYYDCPDPSLDIVDPGITRGERITPLPSLGFLKRDPDGTVTPAGTTTTYSLLAPERPHYAETDLTDPPGDWNPRRPDWASVLTQPVPSNLDFKVKQVLTMLSNYRIDESFRALAAEPVPFGLWKVKDGCDFSRQKRARDFTNETRPAWFAKFPDLQPDAPIYQISPGEAVFSQICSNCHGPQADSRGRLAASIADMTGGQTRVANLRDGFFGPSLAPGSNIERVFGGVGKGLTTEEWATRYLLWMGSGGTRRLIPPAALALVASAQVLGVRREGLNIEAKDANMLSVVSNLCTVVLGRAGREFDFARGVTTVGERSGLIAGNGDAELWQKLCTYNNPLPGLALRLYKGKIVGDPNLGELWDRAAYPSDVLVGDPARGLTVGIKGGNAAPWCIIRPSDADMPSFLPLWQSTGLGPEPPYCPATLPRYSVGSGAEFPQADEFATRGMFNAGLAVFLYLRDLTQGHRTPTAPYDQCEKLAP